MNSTFALLSREWIRFSREPARVLGFTAAPLLFWAVVSLGFNDFSRFFSGSLALSLMFAAIFNNMTLIDDRKEGFLASVLVSPAPRAAIVLGKTFGSASLATAQSLLFLPFLPLAGLHPNIFQFLGALCVLFLIALVFTLLGFVCAWRMPSTQAFHGVINVVLMPLWMLSGALFPLASAHPWMQMAMRANPMTYALSLLDYCLAGAGSTSPLLSAAVLLAWLTVLLALAIHWVEKYSHASA